MSRLVLAGGGELDVATPAGRVLARCNNVAVVTLAAAFRMPDAIRAGIRAWADCLEIDYVVVETVRRADCLDPATSAPIADADGVLVLDGSPAHLVSALKNTPLLEAIVGAQSGGATVVWSGAAASAVCDPMVDDRGGALTVGLGLYQGVAVATGWDRWPHARRRRLRRMLPGSVFFMALDSGAAVQSMSVQHSSAPTHSCGDTDASKSGKSRKKMSGNKEWTAIGGTIESQQAGSAVVLTSVIP